MNFNFQWLRAALIRSFATFCEAALAMITIGVPFNAIDWKNIFLVGLTAAVYTLLRCCAGLPEVTEDSPHE